MSRWSHLSDDELGARLADELGGEPATRIDEWVRTELRPAVRSRVTARPQGIRTSRLAALAAASALIVVLALLVVAAPTLGPAAPTSTPERTPPTTWTGFNTREFAEAVGSGELRGETHVVTGEVGALLVSCLPEGGLCANHELRGTDPPLPVHTRPLPAPEGVGAQAEVEGVDWRWWKLPDVPAGPMSLLLSVTDDGLVEYIGWLSEEPMGVNSFNLVDPASWSQSEVAVVPGWLTAAGAGMERAGGPPPASIGGLPQRWSGTPAWVVDRAISLDPSDSVPAGDGFRVQNDAYEQFSRLVPTSDVTEPDPGLWAIAPRLEGAGCPDNVVPCWQWNLVARVSYQEADNVAEPVPTPRTPSPSPSRDRGESPATHVCSGPPLPPDTTPVPQSQPTVIDHTGLVVECVVTDWIVTELRGAIEASNKSSDVIQVVWAGGQCDEPIVFTFAREGSEGYALSGDRPPACELDGDLAGLVDIRFSEPVPAASISATLDGQSPDPVPMPTPAVTEPPNIIECPYEDDPEAEPEVTVADYLGMVVECGTGPAVEVDGGERVRNAEGGLPRLVVEWSVPAYCGLPVELSLRPNTDDDAETSHLLTADVSTPDDPKGCRAQVRGQFVTIVLTEPISADDVELILTHDGLGADSIELGDATFSVELGPDPVTHVAGEPINLWAKFLYRGAAEQLTLSSYRAGLTYQQVDGPLLMEGAHSGECDQTSVSSGERRDVPLIGGWGASPDDPNYDFYRSWAESPYLWLPAGTWRIDLYASFVVGSACQGEDIRLQAATIIEVVEAPEAPSSPSPTPAAVPPAATGEYHCGEVNVFDHSGILTSCSIGSGPEPDDDQPKISNPEGDETQLLVEWLTASCNTSPARVTIWPVRDEWPRLVVVAETWSPEGQACWGFSVSHHVTLSLASPISADDVELVFLAEGREHALAETSVGSFVFLLNSDATTYAAGAPIEITARLAYEGRRDAVTISGASLDAGFRFTQLDGSLQMETGVGGVCEDQREVGNDQVVTRAAPFVGYSGDSPDTPWYRQWSQSDYLWLPAGTWLIQAYSNFHVGPDCGDEQVRLRRDLIITVEE